MLISPASRLMIDAPAAGESAAGWVRISGWSVAEGVPATPTITVNGEPTPTCIWRVGRPDVVAHYGLVSGLEYGFEGWVDLGGRVGPVSLGAHVAGRDDVEPAALEVDAQPPSTARLRIEGPRAGTIGLDVVDTFGWAYGVTAEIETVMVEGPGIRQDADLGLQRPDVETEGISAPAARCGWRATVDVSDAPDGLLPLAVVVTDVDGGHAVAWNTISRITPTEPAVEVDRLEVHGDRLCVGGYVIWPLPTPNHATAAVACGTELLARGPADRARPDLAQLFPDRLREARCGFTLWVPRPTDDRGLTVSVVADDGRYAHADLPAVYPPVGVSAVVPPSRALDRYSAQGGALLDWGVGVDATGLPWTVFSPLDAFAALLPHRDRSVDLVVLTRDAGPERRSEAERVASRAVLTPSADGKTYDVLWSDVDIRNWPSVSVVIPVYRQEDITDDCLRTLLATVPKDVRLDVILVDDGSPTPTTFERLESWAREDTRVRPIKLEKNLGYLGAVNAGAASATGELLVLLNNDTEPQPGWLEALLETFERRPEAGVVGARLMDPDGTLQDAGGVVFADGSAANLGRGECAELPAFSFLRPVHYCTAAAFATPRALWEQVGGFDPRFGPAYYEDVDYCFAVSQLGRTVLMQPESVVVHKEGQSHGTDVTDGVKAHQVLNQRTFAEKWAERLASHHGRPEAPDAVALRRMQMAGRS